MGPDFEMMEPVIHGVVTRLTANIATTVTQVNARSTDGINIAPPVAINDFMPTLAYLPEFPAYGIQDLPSRVVDDTGYGAVGVHEIIIWAFDQDPELRALAWRLRRHTQAILKAVLTSDGTTPTRSLAVDEAYGIRIERIVPGPTLGREEPRVYMSMAGVQLTFTREED